MQNFRELNIKIDSLPAESKQQTQTSGNLPQASRRHSSPARPSKQCNVTPQHLTSHTKCGQIQQSAVNTTEIGERNILRILKDSGEKARQT